MASDSNSTTCQHISEAYPNIVDGFGVRLLFGFLYCIVWLPGIAGNILVLYVALFEKISFTVRTIFITSLATSDLVIGLSSLPFTGITIFTRVWPFTGFMCHLIAFIQSASTLVSSFTLTAIACDRYFLIVKPHKHILTYQRARICIAGIWFCGYIISLPLGIFVDLVSYENDSEKSVCDLFCEERWHSDSERRFYGISITIMQFGLPLCLSCICYTLISNTLGKQIEQRKKQTILPEAQRRLIQRRRRTNRMMTSMVFLFALAWLPMLFVNFIRDFGFLESIVDEYNLIYAVCHLASMTSIIWNPIIYSWFNEPFRAAIKSLTDSVVKRFCFSRFCSGEKEPLKMYEKSTIKSTSDSANIPFLT